MFKKSTQIREIIIVLNLKIIDQLKQLKEIISIT